MAAPLTACVCWRVGTIPHGGHCCFDGPAEAYQGDAVLPPCGHWHPSLPVTDVTGETTTTRRDTRSAGDMGRKVA